MSRAGEDEMPRLRRFRAAHPDIRIDSPAGSRSPFCSAHQDGKCLAAGYRLAGLLDALEWLYPPGPAAIP